MSGGDPIKRFMIVDEDDEHLTFFKVMLRERQIQEVSTVSRPAEAIAMIEAKRIQFVITAWEMEEMKGTVLVQKIHGLRQFKHLPCLLYSKQLTENAVRLAKEVGIEVLRIPLKKEEVWPILEGLVRREENLDPTELKLRGVEALLAEKQYKPALAALKDLLGQGPFLARAHTLLGEALVALEEYGKAEKALDTALVDHQHYTPAMQVIAKVYSKTDRHDKAIKMLTRMVENSPENITTLLGLGATYSEVGELSKAKLTLARVKELDPENKAADDELGKIAMKEGNIDLAQKFLAETENAEELGRFFNNLAIGLVAKGDFDDGLRTYEAGINILHDKTKINFLRYNMALAFRKRGEFDKAFAILAACYLSNPEFERAYEALVRLVREMDRRRLKYDKDITRRIQEMRDKAG